MRIEVPTPALIVLVGPAGAGKSTLAARLFAPDEVVSSDAIRAELTGSAAEQRRNADVFRMLHERVARRLRSGGTAVADATNVEARARRALVRISAASDVPAIAVVLALPLAVVLARNAARAGRPVPDDVVRRHWHALEQALRDGTLETEGFTRIHLIGDASQVDRLTVSR